ncbi:MAG TPA: oligopeptide transporter, OPT family [Phycisphaerae bacterium]|nr:oligopeptide transporter, OPT family [Phycisphaerae bacterium]
MREFTPLAILLGVLIGIVFGAANAFVGLQVGMTISASIPAAVISMAVMRGLLKRGTLLENNMVQTVGSAGESLAAGMIFTIPALFIMGFEPKYLELVIWGGVGGLMGVLMMVPLRRVLIVKEHETLPYPEGVACAEVLESGQRGGTSARTVFWGLGVGAVYEVFRGLGFWQEKALYGIGRLRTEGRLDAAPALLGVGYILGPRVAGYMLGGAVLGWFVLIPAIALFGADAPQAIAPARMPISEMAPVDLHEQYIRYIGAGAVVLGGLLSLIKSGPTILSSFWHALRTLLRREGKPDRTQRDIPFTLLLLALVGLWALMWYVPQVNVSHAGAIAVLVFGFFFVTVSSRLVGIVGSSSNPVSGMTIAALLGTTLIFAYVFNETGPSAKYAAISVGALVCIALCIAGDCSQDLKTGYLVRATPWKQQVGEVIGVLTSAVALAGVLWLLHRSYGFDREANPNALLAPQANIMRLLVDGVMGGSLPWVLIITGMAVALVVELLGLSALPFAVGLYLPLELTTPIMVGGILRWLVGRIRRGKAKVEDAGILGASGLVAGHGLVGVTMAGATYAIARFWSAPKFLNPLTPEEGPGFVVPRHFVPWLMGRGNLPMRYGLEEQWFKLLPLVPFALLVLWLFAIAVRRRRAPIGETAAGTGLPPPPDGYEPPGEPVEGAADVPPANGTGPAAEEREGGGADAVGGLSPQGDGGAESDDAEEGRKPGGDRWPPPSPYQG